MAKNAKIPDPSADPPPAAGAVEVDSTRGERPPASPDAEIAAAALVDIVREHHAAVYRYAFRLAGASHDAEDLTQQTFLVAREKIGQLRDAQATRAWLYTVLRNCFLKELRQRQPVLSANLGEAIEAPAAAPVDRESLQQALARLTDEFRLPLLLFYFEELSYREIASALNVPVGTVMSRLARAKAHLRRYWFEEEEEKPRSPVPRGTSERLIVKTHLTP